MEPIKGLHHVTAVARDPQRNMDFYRNILGQRLVKRTVNFDSPDTYHFYFGDEAQKRIDRYNALAKEVKELRAQINPKDANAFFELVYYPVMGAAWINKKFLYRDKAYLYSRQTD